MKKFLIKTLILIVPILIIGISIEIMIRKIPNDYIFKRNYLDDNAENIETLILGSSHSFYGLNPRYFSEKTFNASHISQSFDYDYKIIKNYEQKLTTLRTIILPISYFSLYDELAYGAEPWRVKNYTIYYDFDSVKSFENYSEVLTHHVNINAKRMASYYIYNVDLITCNNLGWGTKYSDEDSKDLITTGRAAAIRHTKEIYNKEGIATFERNKLILQKMILFAQQNNIRILFLTFPAYESYYNHLNDQQLNNTIQTVESILNECSDCKYLNLLKSPIFKASDFYDADHLSTSGAEKLSKIVDKELQRW